MCFDYKFFLHLLVLISFSLNANSNSSNIIENLKIEKGFSIEIFLENIDTPRQMAESDAGSIFVGSRSGVTIIAIDKSKNVRIIAKDLSNSTGVTYHNGDLYFSEVNSIWKIENVDETLSRSESIPEKLVTNNLPSIHGTGGSGLILALITNYMYRWVHHAIFAIHP